eukprot:gene9566-16737_t
MSLAFDACRASNLPATLPAPELDAQHAAEKKARTKKSHGFLKLKIFFDGGPSELVVQVYEARDLKASSAAKSSPYCKMYLLPDKTKKTKKKSTPRKGTVNPYWEQEFRWKLSGQKTLEITLWNNAGVKSDFMGRTSMKLDQMLPPATAKEGWFELYEGDRGKHEYRIMELIGEPSAHYVALFDYNPRCKQELLLRQDDLVNLISGDRDWSLVENAISSSQGYVPSSFIAIAQSLESEPWFFGKVTRGKAEKLLLNPMRKHGCFLIRESESQAGSYSLSMRDGDSVRHFRVQTLPDGAYRLQGSPSPPFSCLPELVLFHKKKKAGLTTTLKEACPQEHKPVANDVAWEMRDKWEIARSEIDLKTELGHGQYGEVYRGIWTHSKDEGMASVEVAVKTMNLETVVQKLDEGYRHPKPAGCPDGLYELMNDCWKTEPVDRPTFESLTFRLEDFFHSAEANYTDPTKFVDESENPSELPDADPEPESKKMETPADNADSGDEDGGDGSAEGGGAAAE